MNTVSKEILTEIVKDWHGQFPSLSPFRGGTKLLKRVGPVVLGIEIEKYLSDAYRPRFILINLLDNSHKRIFYVIEQEIFANKQLIVGVKYSKHKDIYLEACALIKQQSRIDLFKNNLVLTDILNAILREIEMTKKIVVPYNKCLAILQLSCLLKNKKEKEMFNNIAIELVKSIPQHILEYHTKGDFSVIYDTINLGPADLQKKINESLRKYKLMEVPAVKINENEFYN